MRSDKKTPLKSDKKAAPKIQKKGTIGYNKKSALLEDAITQMNAGKYGRASSALKDLLALDPLNAEARRLFATLHLRLGSLMSARTAFESLAREAMERQDYWLAESLLREYLAAGPRCVPFLERLGHVYEEKGDVMAAVAEYGKAVEVLLEDPDREHPNRASELFGRIRSIAPGSPVAFRFAAMFDTVTGHVLQATPQPAVGDSGSELPQPTPVPESLADNSTLVPMPWEQMESPPPEGALSPEVEVPSVGDSIETMASVTPLASVQSATETLGQVNAPDRSPATEVANSPTALELQLHHESSSLSVASSTESIQVTGQNAPPVNDSALPTPTVAEDSQAAIEVLAQASSHPIKEEPKGPTPMPWDQIEDAAPAISPEADRQAPIASEVAPPLSVEADLPVPPVAEILQSTIEASAEGTRHPIAGSMTTLASMPWDQVDDVASATSPVTDSDRSMGAEVVFALSEDAELPLAPVVEAASPTIEVLRNVSAHPIAEAPISPASMPWDQIEEKAEASSPTADLKMDAEVMEAASAKELTATDLLLNGGTTAEPLIPPDVPFTSSSGLSWEDILAAVTAMQAVPGPVQSVPRTESEASTNSAVPEETATTVTPPIDPSETEWLSLVPPVSNSFTGLVTDSPPLSAPMPWEQIEVEDLAIPRQDPEPEFGSVSTDVMGGPQDSTVVMPVAMEMHESVSATGVFAEETVVDSLGHLESPSTPEFRILSPDAPVEPREQPISIHIPVKMVGSVEEPALAAVSESKPPVESTIALSIDLPLRLAGSEATPEPESDEPRAVPAESLTEAVVTASPGMPPLIVKPAAVQDIQVPLAASTNVFPAEPISLVDQPIAQVAGQEPTIPMTQETVVDAAGPSAIPSFIAHQPLVQADLTALVSETVGVEEDVAPMSESETSPLLAQGHASMPAGIVSNAETSQLRESVVPDEEVPNESALPVSDAIQAQSTDTPVVVPSDEPSLTSIESMRAAEAAQAAAAAAPDASAVGGLRILWDDSSSKPIPCASTGNMLTRWLSKPKEVAPSEANHSTTIPVEPMSPVAPPAGERQEATPLVTAPLWIDRTIPRHPLWSSMPLALNRASRQRDRHGVISVGPQPPSSALGSQQRDRWLS